MARGPEDFIVSHVPDSSATEAFTFHQARTSTNPYLDPRSEGEIQDFASKGELFGVRKAHSGEFVGLCYATLDENRHEWEFGGLAVLEEVQDLGLATVLARFALCSIVVDERPWDYKDEIIVYVHEENPAPRGILDEIGFEPFGGFTWLGSLAPPSMKRNSEGNVVGDKFRFPRLAVHQLEEWFNRGFNGILRDGKSRVILEVRPYGPDAMGDALREEVKKIK
jgi:hypothetical protein